MSNKTYSQDSSRLLPHPVNEPHAMGACLLPPRFLTVCTVNAQTCPGCYDKIPRIGTPPLLFAVLKRLAKCPMPLPTENGQAEFLQTKTRRFGTPSAKICFFDCNINRIQMLLKKHAVYRPQKDRQRMLATVPRTRRTVF